MKDRVLRWFVIWLFFTVEYFKASKENEGASPTTVSLESLAKLSSSSDLKMLTNYAVVIDAGSTGSRAFVYKFMLSPDESIRNTVNRSAYTNMLNSDKVLKNRTISGTSCGKVRPGLSSFSSNPFGSVSYIQPLLTDAAELIPSQFYKSTKVYIKGTAGMRFLNESAQDEIWKSLLHGLNELKGVPFSFKKYSCVGTIDGYREAYYAVLAANYIEGTIDGNLKPVEGKSLVGALDMGGGSTQLIFFNPGNEKSRAAKQKKHLTHEDFWSHSWLNYGVEAIKERLLGFLYDEYVYGYLYHKPHMIGYGKNAEEEFSLDMPWYISTVIHNPCLHRDYIYQYSDQLNMSGTGDPVKCTELMTKVIWEQSGSNQLCEDESKPCPIDNVIHPNVEGHKFYAMSVYFYAYDALRVLGPISLDHWPTPTLAELEYAAHEFCRKSWLSLKSEKHEYTRRYQLPFRCLETLYLTRLLDYGFGFNRHSRDITLALEVKGHEVEWTLGFALAEVTFDPFIDEIFKRKHFLGYVLPNKVGNAIANTMSAVKKRFTDLRRNFFKQQPC